MLLPILLGEYGLYDKVGFCEETDPRDKRMCKVYSLKAWTVTEAWVKDYWPERQVEGQPCGTDLENLGSKTERGKNELIWSQNFCHKYFLI